MMVGRLLTASFGMGTPECERCMSSARSLLCPMSTRCDLCASCIQDATGENGLIGMDKDLMNNTVYAPRLQRSIRLSIDALTYTRCDMRNGCHCHKNWENRLHREQGLFPFFRFPVSSLCVRVAMGEQGVIRIRKESQSRPS